MDGFIDRDRFEGLMAMAEPLMELALEAVSEMPLELSPGWEELDPEALEKLKEMQRGTQAVAAAMQAVMLGTNLPEIGLVLALATALGTIIGQARGDKSLLWSQFKERASSTMQSVSFARAPTEGQA